jgi:tetratricopeptide (TPR) repeat protein
VDRETLAALGVALWAMGGAERARSDALSRSLAGQQLAETQLLRRETERLAAALGRMECAASGHAAAAHPYRLEPKAVCRTCGTVIDHEACCTNSMLQHRLALSAINNHLPALAVEHASRALEMLADEETAGIELDGATSVAGVLRTRSAALRDLGETEAADADLQLATGLEPRSPQTLVALADAAEASGRWGEAVELLGDAIAAISAAPPDDLPPWYRQAGNVLRRRRAAAANRAGLFEDARRWALEELAERPGLTWAEIALDKANAGLARSQP